MGSLDEETPGSSSLAGESAPRAALSDRPLRCVQRCCPFITRWLEAIGCEEALVVRDMTHLSLYLSCVLALFCTAIWGADVCTGDCLLPRPWLAGTVDRYRCIYEVFGVVVFFGTLYDSVEMLANYDNDHQVLLKRKRRLMEEVKQETVEAMQKAEDNANKLTEILKKGLESDIQKHVEEYFGNVEPRLYEHLGPSSPGGFERDLLEELCVLVGRNLNEVGELAVAYHSRLALVSRGLAPTVRTPADRRPEFWCLLFQGAPKATSDIDKEVQRHPGRFIFKPVKDTVEFVTKALGSDKIKNLQRYGAETSIQRPTAARLYGCGGMPPAVDEENPNEQSRVCICCLPRLLAYVLRLLCCCSCCSCCRSRSGGRRPGFFQFALTDYPKFLKLGCFWIKIISRLHERLVQGLVLTAIFLAFYLVSEVRIISNLSLSGLQVGEVWDCAWDMSRRVVITLALVCHIPCLFLCLVRIQDLEAIIRITEDIWQVRDIRRVVEELKKSVEKDEFTQSLLQAVKDRVLARACLVSHLRGVVVCAHTTMARPELLAATTEAVGRLRAMFSDVPAAADWVELPKDSPLRRRLWSMADEGKTAIEEAARQAREDQAGDTVGGALCRASTAGQPGDDRSPALPRDDSTETAPAIMTSSSSSAPATSRPRPSHVEQLFSVVRKSMSPQAVQEPLVQELPRTDS